MSRSRCTRSRSSARPAQFQEIADKFAEIFPNPATIHDFLLDPAKAAAYVESVAAAH